jgi:hypothetical protein
MGHDLIARDEDGKLRTSIASLFPLSNTLITLPGIHFTQRMAFVDSIQRARAAKGLPPLSENEEETEMELSVDLFVNEQGVLIRPDPSRMDLALAADELLQLDIPKRKIKYLNLSDRRVRESLTRRGECWRIFLPPTAPKDIRSLIAEARSAIEGRAIYYYSAVTGTRWLTFENLHKLGELDDAGLAKHLTEIATYTIQYNRNGYPEVKLFTGGAENVKVDFDSVCAAAPAQLRARFDAFCRQLRDIIPVEFQRDDVNDPTWRKQMFGCLITQRDDVGVDDDAMGLDPEFSIRVEWLPGGRIEEGELIIDPAIEERYGARQEKQVSSVVPGLILNLVQEYGDLEYINLGSVLPSPNRNEQRGGRREVHVAQIKQRRAHAEVLQILRMQKWGVREKLDEGKSLEEAMIESEEYGEYVLDRRLACRQLGMNLSISQTARRVSETYNGTNARYRGRRIWSPYFQRDYIPGVGTDQVSAAKLANPTYATSFALLLGQAAACNIILGRAELSGEIVFDLGDEILVENLSGLPAQIVVSDHVGTFVDWNGPLEARAGAYAGPVNRRLKLVENRDAFTGAFLSGFTDKFIRIKEEYARHRRAFDTIFKYRPWDPRGSLAFRWSSVLERLSDADPRKLSQLISSQFRLPAT